MTRSDVIEQAATQCMKELYSKAQPHIEWEDFKQECKEYSDKYIQWQEKRRNGEDIDINEFCGPRPYEFYYLPSDIFKEIAESYVRAYGFDTQGELLNTIEVLKDYCENPIVDSYVKESDGEMRRGYHHPDPLREDIATLLRGYIDQDDFDAVTVSKEIVENFYEFLDMAGQFYNWNRDLNTFNTTVYLGASPCSNKETVIKNWRQYRDKTIYIDESVYIEDEEWK